MYSIFIHFPRMTASPLLISQSTSLTQSFTHLNYLALHCTYLTITTANLVIYYLCVLYLKDYLVLLNLNVHHLFLLIYTLYVQPYMFPEIVCK